MALVTTPISGLDTNEVVPDTALLPVVISGTTYNTPASIFRKSIDIRAKGAKVDGVEGFIGTADGSTTVTATASLFAATDVGKHFSAEAVGAGVTVTNAESDGGLIRITAANHTFFNDHNFDDQRVTIKGVTGTTEANGNFQVSIVRYVVTGAADNGAGLIRLTLADDVFVTGDNVTVTDIRGTTEANGDFTVTRIDATHIDLQGSTFTNTFEADGRIKFKDKFNLAGSTFSNAYTSGGTAHGPLSTTIASYLSPTQVTLTVAPSATAAAQDFFFGTDDTAAVQDAVDAANGSIAVEAVGGGYVDMPAGICVIGEISWKDRVIFRGASAQSSVWKAIGGLDGDLFKTANFDALTGTDVWRVINGNYSHIGFENCQIDGSKRYQRANGDGVKLYGKAMFFINVIIRDCKGNGMFTESGATTGQRGWFDEPPGSIGPLFVRECGGHAWHMRGGHDAVIKQALLTLCGGDGFRTEASSTYSGICDVGFIHSTANRGYGWFSNVGCRGTHYIGDSCQKEALYLEGADNFQIAEVQAFGCCSVIGDYQVNIDSDTSNAVISNLLTFNNGRTANGGLQVNGLRNYVHGTVTGGVTGGGGTSTGVGVDIPANADRNNVDVIIALWQGTGAIALRTGNGGANRLNRIRATLLNSSTLWNNVTAGVGNIYEINGDTESTDTMFSGVGPATENNKEIWNVVLRDNTPDRILSDTSVFHGTTVDLNVTTLQTFTIPHRLLTTPGNEKIQLTTRYNGSNTVWEWGQSPFVAAVDATNVTVKCKLRTAAGAAETATILMRAKL